MSPISTTLSPTQPEVALYRKLSTSGLEAAAFLLPVYTGVQTVRFLPERDYVTFGSLLSQIRLSSVVCLSVVCRL